MILKPVGVESVVVRRCPATGSTDRRIDRSILDRARVSRDGRACTDVCNAQIQKKKKVVDLSVVARVTLNGSMAGALAAAKGVNQIKGRPNANGVGKKSTCRRSFRLMGVCVPLRAAAAAAQGATCHGHLISKHVALMSAPDTFRRPASVECELSRLFRVPARSEGRPAESSTRRHTDAHTRTHARTRTRTHACKHSRADGVASRRQ